ncbi:MAG: ABC transporter permease [Thermoplasmata archaeon]|nr:ABC transporter permease [Thermoplasmata archaeon]TFG71011.1 MAG: ABC transporter permease [Methanomassiliicoccus sp.]
MADKLGLSAKGLGRVTDLFLATWMGRAGLAIIAFFLLLAVYATLFVDYDPTIQDGTIKLQDFNWEHPFGTDHLGRDILDRILVGTKPSLIVGFSAMIISMGIGTLVGLASGYWGGWRDEVIMRINDMFLSVPWLILMIVLASVIETRSLNSIIIVIGITGWSTVSRIVRSQVLTLKERQFIERARAIGSSDWHIIRRHIFPNVVPLVFANAILTVAICILSEATLSFLKLGPQDTETWGKILSDAYDQGVAIQGPYAFIIMPGLFIVFVVLGFTFIGYAMDEVLNPKLRKR